MWWSFITFLQFLSVFLQKPNADEICLLKYVDILFVYLERNLIAWLQGGEKKLIYIYIYTMCVCMRFMPVLKNNFKMLDLKGFKSANILTVILSLIFALSHIHLNSHALSFPLSFSLFHPLLLFHFPAFTLTLSFALLHSLSLSLFLLSPMCTL